MDSLVHSMKWGKEYSSETGLLLSREWIVTNGLGGYASGTVSGAPTRRYHGLLIAALPAPFGRMVMLNHLAEKFLLPGGTVIDLGSEERAENVLEMPVAGYLTEFRLEMGMPVWRYECGGVVIEKQLHLPYMQNTVHVNYKLVSGDGPIRLELRPSMNFRPHESPVSTPLPEPYTLIVRGERYEITAEGGLPPLRILIHGRNSALTAEASHIRDLFYRTEAERGYESRGLLWNYGYLRAELMPGQNVTLIASTEAWPTMHALKPDEALVAELERRRRLLEMADEKARTGMAAELILAADQFIITPAGRQEDAARARASGDEIRTVIAGYHWFTDWGRDTMISLEGLTLSTGRHAEARWILRTFAHYIKDGLIPNLFPEGEKEGLYHTADATLWFFHAVDRYVRVTGDRQTLRMILPKMKEIVDFHLRGTHFGISVDPKDGLLRQGKEGYQLTWMDAKVEDWVVTPRRGKAVEINALWYNALRLLEDWVRMEEGEEAAQFYHDHAERACESFNSKFWYSDGGYLYDIVDGENGNDNALRPNQVFSISLCHPVLEQSRWKDVLTVVKDKLLTPVGLRSLAPGHPDYKSKYFGDLRARDAAYHQGTVWGWLAGPFIDAWLKVYPEDIDGAREFLDGFQNHLNEACIGSISEIFDAEKPYTPRGCIAQAWSVAEALRCLVKTSR